MASYAAIAALAVVLCVALAQAGHVPVVPAYGGHGHVEHEEYAKPHYSFKYGVHDAHTGDIKDQWEERDGDVVKGAYSLVEPDGTLRQVEYTSDAHNGFNAVVKRSGKAVHPGHYGGHQAGAQL